MDYQHILYDYQAGRARVTLNRPEKRNALSGLALKELHHALWRADEDNRVHCVILAGAGKDFCSGYDLNHYKSAEAGAHEERRGHQSFDDDAWHLERSLEQRMPLFDMHKPTIAQVLTVPFDEASRQGAGCCDADELAEDSASTHFPRVPRARHS